jgi:hypothetical protein
LMIFDGDDDDGDDDDDSGGGVHPFIKRCA